MTADSNFALFDTAIGACAIVWGANGITGVQLPEKSEADTRARILRRYPGAVEAAPPAPIKSAIADIVALLSGAQQGLTHIALDLAKIPEFHRRVYAVARTIPPGA